MEHTHRFSLKESKIYPHWFYIAFDDTGLPEADYAVLPARLMCISYDKYLQFCVANLGGEIIGNHITTVKPIFKKTPEVSLFIRVLNARLNYVERWLEYENKQSRT